MNDICRPLLISAILAGIAPVVGCHQKTTIDRSAAAQARSARPGPEESLASIVETFKRGVEQVPIGFVLQNEEGHSMMTGRNTVSHRIIPPAKEGDPFKAIITVSSQSRYSLKQSTDEEDEEDDQEDAEKSTDSRAQNGADTGVEVIDRNLISQPSNATQEHRATSTGPETADKKVTRQADEQERHYELVYVDGKWTLITPLDPETEQSIENAFKRALEMQI